ncbi:B subunit of glutamyl-tRNA and/or aspartyl-tRNA amidotransferase [Syncephalis fuscata]|nr:B subunit of glutamyl-tRNA and/or aspartyl-tRNA amidotransferase [Syncephalis fuscata]
MQHLQHLFVLRTVLRPYLWQSCKAKTIYASRFRANYTATTLNSLASKATTLNSTHAGLIQSQKSAWNVIIGLEIHAQLCSQFKLFSDAPTVYEDQPNTQVSVIDAAFPGTLPLLNSECVALATRIALALSSQIQTRSSFDRKHYFYHDLPAGYQITQHKEPIARGGELCLSSLDGLPYERTIRLEQLQLEQDTGKSISDITGARMNVDLNRAGMPLIEIVTKPDIRSSYEAGMAVRKLQSILRSIGASNGNMEQGSLRCDVNVSICKLNEPLGVRCELKNLTSIRFLTAAIDAEADRQIKTLESGGKVIQTTRGYDAVRKETFSLRTKETAVDYRYMPDPDLPSIYIAQNYIDYQQNVLPELPDAQKRRFMSSFDLSANECDILFTEPSAAAYFEQVTKNIDSRLAFNWITNELMGHLNSSGISFSNNTVSVNQLRSILIALKDQKINGKIAKKVLAKMAEGDSQETSLIVEANGWNEISDTAILENICQQLVADNIDKVTLIQQGNRRLFGWFVGQVMQQTKGQANPKLVNQLLKALLEQP